MGKVVIPDYEYGHPKNEDYAYDVERQRKVDEEDDRLGLAGAAGGSMSDVKLCRDCRHFRPQDSTCEKMPKPQDYVNGGGLGYSSAQLTREFPAPQYCGAEARWWEAK